MNSYILNVLNNKNYPLFIAVTFIVVVMANLLLLAASRRAKGNSTRLNLIFNLIISIIIILGLNYYLIFDAKPGFKNIFLINLALLILFGLFAYFFSKNKNGREEKITLQKVTLLGLMAGLAFVLRFFGFPIFPGYPYLKLEFSGIIYILVLLWFDFKSALVVSAVTNILRVILQISMFNMVLIVGMDQLVNFISSIIFIVPAAIAFSGKKKSEYPKSKILLLSTILGTLLVTVFMVLWNYYINLPLIYNMSLPFRDVAIYFSLFNVIKWGLVTVIIALTWKQLYSLKDIVYA